MFNLFKNVVLKANGFENLAGDLVRISVGSRAAVLEVALVFSLGLTGHTDRAATVGNTPRKLVDVRRLMLAGHALGENYADTYRVEDGKLGVNKA